MKATRIIYWTTTILIFLFEGVMPALTGNSEMAKQGISHLGYPDYFRVTLTLFKVLGSLGLLLPFVKGRVKEWVYAGFAFDFIFATISHCVVDGISAMSLFPLLVFAVLIASYISYHKLQAAQAKHLTNTAKHSMVYQ